MTTKTIELAKGVSVTLKPADGWAVLKRQAISERLKEFTDGSKTLDNYVWFYSMCAAQVHSVKKLAWQPPEMGANAEELEANFQVWMAALPEPNENITLWLDTIAALNNPTVAEELAPGGDPSPDDPKAKKSAKKE